jgi:two-component system, NtrC family, sensor kinase
MIATSETTKDHLNLKAKALESFGRQDRILIVDDSITVRAALAKQLSIRYDCFQADSYMGALNELRQSEFQIVITDINMPGLSGVELLRKINERYPETSVIMLTGVNRPQVVLEAMRDGAFDYLIKPCDPYLLDLTVERALERRTLIRKAAEYKADLEARNTELAEGKAQLQRLQAQIVQNAKMTSLGRLAAGVAHELNNPVGFVLGNLELLSKDLGGILRLLKYYDAAELSGTVEAGAGEIKSEIRYRSMVDEIESMIADCQDGATRVRDIVANLRTFSRLDEAEFKDIDLHEGIDSTVRMLSRYFSAENIVLVRNFGNVPTIQGYSGQLNQVWMNLLANAAQALGTGGGTVSIATRVIDEKVEIKVTDTGPGIPREDLEHIFDPFYTTKPVGEGTGLGLSISFSIIARHHGSIDVHTEIGSGTTFIVRLPVRAMDDSTENQERSLNEYETQSISC